MADEVTVPACSEAAARVSTVRQDAQAVSDLKIGAAQVGTDQVNPALIQTLALIMAG